MLDSVERFLGVCATWGITVLPLPTAYWHEVSEALDGGRTTWPTCTRLCVIGGEQAQREALVRWQRSIGREVGLLNVYGPTEVTIGATCIDLRREPSDREVAIGRPFPNVRVHVLDAEGHEVATGIAGEVFIGGAGVARGYLRRPELTRERFVPDPWSAESGGRLYRTGDLARTRADGALEFLGRMDQQVKLRGFRIELGEIESALLALPTVREAAAVVSGEGAMKRIVAYVVLREAAEANDVRAKIARSLPGYLVPAAVVALKRLPRTPNGKVDRLALPAPERAAAGERSFVAPRSLAEEAIAAIWREILRLERVGVHDNFFDLGGHSLLATRILAAVRRDLCVDLELRTLFAGPTIAELAAAVESAPPKRTVRARVSPRPGGVRLPLSLGQQQVWVADQVADEKSVFNIPIVLSLRGPLDFAAMKRSLTALVARHEALRTTFPRVSGQAVQAVAESQPFPLSVVPVNALPASMRDKETAKRTLDSEKRPFDLGRGPLLRGTLLVLEAEEHVLLLATHHIVFDGWSWNVLLRDLFTLYRYELAGAGDVLTPLAVQFGDFVLWQNKHLQGDTLDTLLAYWKARLQGDRPSTELRTDFPRPKLRSYAGALRKRDVPSVLLEGTRALGRREGASTYMVLLAAFYVLLAEETGHTDLVVGGTAANRQSPEVQDVIGFFVNMVALRVDLRVHPTFRALVREVKDVVLGAEEHQDLPFEHVVRAASAPHDPSRMPLFQTVLRHEEPPQPIDVTGTNLEVTDRASYEGSAKLDLELVAAESPAGLTLIAQYDVALFEPRSIDDLLERYHATLERFVNDPDTPLFKREQSP